MRRLDDLFTIQYGHSLELNALKTVHAPEGVNFVSRAMGNNGVTARVVTTETPAQAGDISVALGGNGVLSSFVQPEPFVCGRDVMILTALDPAMTTVEKLWWCRCIWENRYRYSYGRQANRTLASLIVPDSPPDWVVSTQMPTHDGLSRPAGQPVKLTNPTGADWAEFSLDSLFDIRKGRRLTKAARSPGATRFIGASEKNNGVTDMADVPAIFPAGVLTVVYNGNSVGCAFYQDKEFFASDDVSVLIPRVAMSRWTQLFIAAIIRHGRSRFTYGYKWTLVRMKTTAVRLPVTAAGDPDYGYMEACMRGLSFSAAIEGHPIPAE